MNKTKKVLIPCSKKDVWLARIAVSSVRYYYPDIPIFLIKDHQNGNFSTQEIEDVFDVKIYPTKRKNFGWGFSKIEPFLIGEDQLTFIMDADAVMTGRCLEDLEKFNADVVVSGYQEERPEKLKQSYFDIEALSVHDKEFVHNGQVFNSGQMLINFSKFDPSDFENTGVSLENESIKSTLKHIFGQSDQGILNYVFLKKSQLNKILLVDSQFMLWPHAISTPILSIKGLEQGNSYPNVMHWAGGKDPVPSLFKQSHVLLFFERLYYRKIRFGSSQKFFRLITRTPIRILLSALLKKIKA